MKAFSEQKTKIIKNKNVSFYRYIRRISTTIFRYVCKILLTSQQEQNSKHNKKKQNKKNICKCL